MDVNFNYTDGESAKVYFESIQAEKNGGGLVSNPTEDLAPTTPLVVDSSTGVFSKAGTSATPVAVLGSWVYANKGDQMAKIVYAAVIRKETAVITSTQAAKIAGITLA